LTLPGVVRLQLRLVYFKGKLTHPEAENKRLKQMFADLSLENQVSKETLRKK
jgi:putative transposase